MHGDALAHRSVHPEGLAGLPAHLPTSPCAFRQTCYEIAVENPRRVTRGISRVELDGNALPTSDDIPLVDDGRTHTLRVVLG